jgi:hypothetical protein
MLKQVQHDKKGIKCHSELGSESQCRRINYVSIR